MNTSTSPKPVIARPALTRGATWSTIVAIGISVLGAASAMAPKLVHDLGPYLTPDQQRTAAFVVAVLLGVAKLLGQRDSTAESKEVSQQVRAVDEKLPGATPPLQPLQPENDPAKNPDLTTAGK